jgi:hypothetical protein
MTKPTPLVVIYNYICVNSETLSEKDDNFINIGTISNSQTLRDRVYR